MVTESPKINSFVNGILALSEYVKTIDLYDFAKVAGAAKTPRLNFDSADLNNIGKLLLNSLSAEYALRITPVVNDEQYLQGSLHWTFPQAYYSVLFSARAFLLIQGAQVSNEDLIRKRIGTSVVRGYYPAELSFYATGAIDNYTIKRLQSVYTGTEIQANIRKSINVTRGQRMMALRSAIRNSPEFVFQAERDKELAKQIGYTTYFDLMSRLRISSDNREVEQFISGDFDVKVFHAALVEIVSKINAVHEIYIRHAVGKEAFRGIIDKLPFYLKENVEGLQQLLDYNYDA